MRIAILGCGSIGQRHLSNLQGLGYGDLVAFDPVAQSRDDVARQYDVAVSATLEKVWIQQPQVVLVTAPSNLHLDLAMEAAHHGCAIFIEKPLSHALGGIENLLGEIQRRNLITMVGCNMRFHPGPAQVKQCIDDGTVGTVLAARIQTGSYLPRWRPWQDYRHSYSASVEWGGAVLDCIHELDLALWLLGEASLRVAVTRPANSLGLQTDGLAELLLEHSSGAVSSVHLNFVQRNYRRSIEIIGSDGTIEWDFTTGHVDMYGRDGDLATRAPQPDGWTVNDMYRDEMAYFMQHVQEARPTCNPVALAVQTLALALAARKA